MTTPQFCVSCDTLKANIYSGLTSFQQHEEFVDMTLAADGHFVKVHQIVVSLASPYLKQLILSAPCQHPVVFLNKISYPILCHILEYIYSGEVMVDLDSLPEFIAAGKELHIKGLEDMSQNFQQDITQGKEMKLPNEWTLLGEESKSKVHKIDLSGANQDPVNPNDRSYLDNDMDDPFGNVGEDHHHSDVDDDQTELKHKQSKSEGNKINLVLQRSQNKSVKADDGNPHTVQFTLSTHGHLQLILNRFLYHLNYSHKSSPMRTWVCVDSRTSKCRATVVTKENVVIRRHSAHCHGFHDKKIMKKLQTGSIFSAIKDAVNRSEAEKSQNT